MSAHEPSHRTLVSTAIILNASCDVTSYVIICLALGNVGNEAIIEWGEVS